MTNENTPVSLDMLIAAYNALADDFEILGSEDKALLTTHGGVHVPILSAVSSVSTGLRRRVGGSPRIYQCFLTGSGQVDATVEVYGNTKDQTEGSVLLGTFVLSGNGGGSDHFTSTAPWPFVYGKVTAISGTDASVDLEVGK